MTSTIIGLALAFNILVIIWKIKHRGLLDGLMDALLLGVVMFLTSGTLTGLLIGTIASFVISGYLLIYPFEPIKWPKLRLPRIRLWTPKMPSFSWKFKLPSIRIIWA